MGLKLASAARIGRYEAAGYWGEGCLHDFLARNAQISPDAPALADAPDREKFAQGPPCTLNTTETLFAVERLCVVFEQLGLVPGDLLGLQLPQIIEAPIAILAAARAGLMVCLLPPHWRKPELLASLSPVAPRAILSWAEPVREGPSRLETIREVAAELPSVRFLLAIGNDVPDGIVPLGPFAFDARQRTRHDGPDDTRKPVNSDASQADDVVLVSWPSSAAPGDRALARSHNEYKATGLAIVNAAGLHDGARLLCPYSLMSYPAVGAFLMPWLLCQGCLVFHRAFDLAGFSATLTQVPTAFTAIPAQIEPQVLAALTANPASLASLGCLGIMVDPKVTSLNRMAPPHSPFLLDILNLSDLALHAGIRTSNGQIKVQVTRRTRSGKTAPAEVIETHLAPPRADDAPGAAELFVRSPMTPSAAVGGAAGAFSPLQDADGFVAAGLVARPSEAGLVPSAIDRPGKVVHGGIVLNLADLKTLYSSWPPVADVKITAIDDDIMGARLSAALCLALEEFPRAVDDFYGFLRQQGAGPHLIPDEVHISFKASDSPHGETADAAEPLQAISAGL